MEAPARRPRGRSVRPLAVAVGLLIGLLPADRGAAAAGVRVEQDADGRWRVEATGVPLAELLARIGAATGVPITVLSPAVERAPVTVTAGPAPLDRLVRQLVRPNGLAVLYGPGGTPASPVRIVVVPAGGAAHPAVPVPARLDVRVGGAWWRLEDVGPAAEPADRETAVLTLGEALDDPGAVALLEAVARGDAGLGADDPARRLARRILEALPGGAGEADQEGEADDRREGAGHGQEAGPSPSP